MKKNLSKIGLIFLSVVLTVMIVCNSYIFLVTYKLSSSVGIFEKMEVINKYHVFHQLWMGAFSILLTVLLLIIVLVHIIRDIFKFKNQ